jgi:hypothetical protein
MTAVDTAVVLLRVVMGLTMVAHGIVVGLGVLGAAVLLAATWRPTRSLSS